MNRRIYDLDSLALGATRQIFKGADKGCAAFEIIKGALQKAVNLDCQPPHLSPLPWRTKAERVGVREYVILDATNRVVASIYVDSERERREQRANARAIVKAVNAHFTKGDVEK